MVAPENPGSALKAPSSLERLEIESQITEARFRAYSAGARRIGPQLPVILSGASVPFIALTSWGKRWLQLPSWLYFLASFLFVCGIIYANYCYRHFDALSPKARWAERLESWASLFLEALIVFGPSHVLHWGWLAFAIHISLLVPLKRVHPDSLYTTLGVMGATCLAFLFRDGWAAFGIALLLGVGCLIPLHVIGAMDEKNFRLEIEQRITSEALAQAEVELERHRIASTLHDSIAGRLNALLWRVRALTLALPDGQGNELEKRLKDCLVELRGVVWQVEASPPTVEQFLERARELLEGLSEPRLHYQLPSGNQAASLPPNIAASLYSAIAELTNNALVHSHASNVWVQLNEHLELSVRDNGSGIPSDALRKGGGLERLKQAITRSGGELELRPEHPHGTEALVRFPRRSVSPLTTE